MKKVIIVAIIAALVILFSVVSVSCDSSPAEEPSPAEPLPAPEPETPAPGPVESWQTDGILGDNEYLGEMQYGDFEIHWVTDGVNAFFGIRVRTEGWVAVGFNPAAMMKDADMVLGLVQDGEALAVDQFSTGTFGPHSPDTALGGSDDIISFGGREEGGYTTIEFARPLATGDTYDNDLSGTVRIIWSYGATDDTTQKHVARGYGEITL